MAQGRRAALSVLGTRPSRGPRQQPHQVLVAYESRGGRTAHAAGLIASNLRDTGAVVRAVPLGQLGVADLLETDLVIIGTWVQGFMVTGVGPARATQDWLAALPLPGLRTATFCTYAISPRGTLPAMRQALEDRGMTVMAEAAFGPRSRGIAAETAQFASRLLALAWPGKVTC